MLDGGTSVTVVALFASRVANRDDDVVGMTVEAALGVIPNADAPY